MQKGGGRSRVSHVFTPVFGLRGWLPSGGSVALRLLNYAQRAAAPRALQRFSNAGGQRMRRIAGSVAMATFIGVAAATAGAQEQARPDGQAGTNVAPAAPQSAPEEPATKRV